MKTSRSPASRRLWLVITAAASGQMLRFNGSSWVNEDSPYDVWHTRG